MKILSKLFPEIKPSQQVVMDKKEPVTAFSYEDKKIKEIFEKNGEPLTSDKMAEVKAFINETSGDLESKLITLETSIKKDVEITRENLKAVHTALQKDINIKDVLPEVFVKKIFNAFPKEMKAQIKPLLDSGISIEEATKILIQGKLSEVLMASFETSEETSQHSLVETPISGASSLPVESKAIAVVVSETIEQPVKINVETVKETYFEDTSSEFEIIEDIFSGLGESLDEIAEIISPHVTPEFMAMKQPIRKIIETVMTVKMAETKETFDIYQKSIQSQLDQLNESKPVEMKVVLRQVIDKLDHIIMKTDVPLYTDMKTERDLLASSGQLEKARVLLDTEPEKAIKIIKEIKVIIASINYRPVKQKIYGVAKQVLIEKLYDEQLIKSVPFKIQNNMQLSPRAVLETIRGLGLNHESEVSELLTKESKALKAPANMKAILMKLEETADHKVQAKEMLENLTGQQLMNKLEIKSQKQQMLFNLPITINNDTKHLKVHVNAKKDNQKIDWQNSRLYFVIHLDKLGDTGVLVDVNKGAVHITIKNDTKDLDRQMKAYVAEGVKRLEAIGFTTSTVKFEPLHTEKENTKESKEGFEVTL